MHCSCKECVKNTTAVVLPEQDIYNLIDKCSYSLVLVRPSLVFGFCMCRWSNCFGQAAKLKVSADRSWNSVLSVTITS